MYKHIIVLAVDICKAKTLAFIKPFDTCGFESGLRDDRRVNILKVSQCRLASVYWWLDLKHFYRLYAAFCNLRTQFDPSAISDRILPEVTQYVGVQQDIWSACISNYEAKSLYGIKPLHAAAN